MGALLSWNLTEDRNGVGQARVSALAVYDGEEVLQTHLSAWILEASGMAGTKGWDVGAMLEVVVDGRVELKSASTALLQVRSWVGNSQFAPIRK